VTDERQLVLLLTALAIGLLIGIERGWHGLRAEKPHIPGVRTYGLIGLLGGVTGLAERHVDAPLFGLAFLAFCGVMVTVHVAGGRGNEHAGITSLLASLLTFALGMLAALGNILPAAAFAVLTTLMLGLKPWFRRSVARLEEGELHATLKLLLITVVLLPVLPDQGYGPGGVLNPYEIWWMVVMIAAISFSGYFAVKVMGESKGVLATSLFAGLASSTSLTLHFARAARRSPAETDLLAAGILLAGATLFPRILVIAAVFRPDLALALVPAMAGMAVTLLGPALLVWLRRDKQAEQAPMELENPLELGAAMRFGALLAGVLVLTRLLDQALGDTGLLIVGALSGLVDLNAITLAVARMSADEASRMLALSTVVLASVVNGLFKSGLVALVGTRALAIRVGAPMLVAGVVGIAAVAFAGDGLFAGSILGQG
jgi:uncharacterized membrane protein (DUF4010 family)